MTLVAVSPLILIPALALAVADWFFVARESHPHHRILKPATMIALIGATWLITLAAYPRWQAVAFLIGFILSLAGDVFLLFPENRHFILGLIAFLLGHLCYIVGLNQTLPPVSALVLAVPIAAVGLWLLARIVRAISTGHHKSLIGPVAIYSLVISIMLWSAWATLFRPDWNWGERAAVIVGATLFFASDSLLAWNKFVQPLRWGQVATMSTYHLGQIALALSLLA